MHRRELLTTGAGALAVALAGCTSNGGGDAGTETTVAETTAAETTAGTTAAGDESTVVTVGPGGSLSFDPDEVTVATGTTVRWEWASGGHNVRPSSQPSDADWSGTEGGDGDTYGSGHTHEFAFEVAGTYDYYCAPHRSSGMTGSVVVE